MAPRTVICGGDPTARRALLAALPAGIRAATTSAVDTAGLVEAGRRASVAVIVTGAGARLEPSIRHHTYLVWLLRVRRVVLAVAAAGLRAEELAQLESDFRGYCAQLPLDCVTVVPLGRDNYDGDGGDDDDDWYRGPTLAETLAELDAVETPGAMPVAEAADLFDVDLIWLSDAALRPGRRYLARFADDTADATLAAPKHRIDPDSLQALAARTLERDQIGLAQLTLTAPLRVPAFAEDRALGTFTLSDPGDPEPLARGLVRFALRRTQNLHWQALSVDKPARAAISGHKPAVVWFTGLSGSGKSAIANLVEQALYARGARTYLLDGDNLRQGLNKDLGFSEPDRIENIRRVTEVARLMVDAGLIVLVSFISPFREQRRTARAQFAPREFVEVFVDTPLAVAEARDVKGLYAKARRGQLRNFTGIDSPYEPPDDPEVHIETLSTAAPAAAQAVVATLQNVGVLSAP